MLEWLNKLLNQNNSKSEKLEMFYSENGKSQAESLVKDSAYIRHHLEPFSPAAYSSILKNLVTIGIDCFLRIQKGGLTPQNVTELDRFASSFF